MPIAYLDATAVVELALAFDQNMRPVIALARYLLPLRLFWYDSAIPAGYKYLELPYCQNPKLSLDDKRPQMSQSSDVILAYLRDGSLYYRQQRDRFQTERLLRSNLIPGTKLRSVGMGRGLRMQFELVTPP